MVLSPGATAFARPATGLLHGTIIDETNAMTLPTAPIEILGTDVLTRTDLDGRYSVSLPAGSYDVKVSFPGYRERLAQRIEIVGGDSTELTVSLVPDSIGFKDEVTVTAAVEPVSASEVAQLAQRKKAGAVQDSLSSEEMSKNSDTNAADAVKRVTGLSVVDNSYVFVRGLGERYSNTTFNGAILPTTEPDRRVVPLDLFQSRLIDSIQVIKTYTPDKPAEFAGGLVEIQPLSFPRQRTLSFAVKLARNDQSTGDRALGYPGGATDWLTFDNGTRALPGNIPTDSKVVRGSTFTGRGYTPEQLQEFGRSFENTWQPREGTGKPAGSGSFMFGDSWGKLGAVLSATWGTATDSRTEVQSFYKVSGGEITLQNSYDFVQTTKNSNLGMVGNFAYRINSTNQLQFANFWTRNSKDETRVFEGFNSDVRTDIRSSRLFWAEEGVWSSKFSGDHFLPGLSRSMLDWAVTYSKATRAEPDLREVLYEFNPSLDDFVLADESQSGFRMFNDLEDKIWQFDANWSLHFNQWGGLPTLLKVGPSLTARNRDFLSRRFRFRPRGTSGVDLTAAPEVIFAAENIGPVFELTEETRSTDTYDAEQTITAGYAMVDLPVTPKLRLIGGVRVERSEQSVNTFDPFAPEAEPVVSALNDTDLLPAANLVWAATPRMNVRLAYSHTVNRPAFRELAPFEFTDVVGGRATVGNPDLERALIRNVDLRWEWFLSADEVLAVSYFVKDFDRPIERVVQSTAQLRTSFDNALGAINQGLEIEARKGLGQYMSASFNYTFVDSQIEIEEQAGQVQTSLERPLAGQSRNLVNGTFELRIPEWDASARLLYNFFDDRIVDVGSLGLPDIIEEGRHTLDVVFTKGVGPVTFRLGGENILDSEHLFTQGGFRQRAYHRGATWFVRASYSAF
jgi:outer membrane receptor protein involved in Fe transport